MTQGIFVNGKRPQTKGEIKAQVAKDPSKVRIEATSVFGNEYDGPLSEMPRDKYVTFVYPSPQIRNNFGNIKWNAKKGIWVVS